MRCGFDYCGKQDCVEAYRFARDTRGGIPTG